MAVLNEYVLAHVCQEIKATVRKHIPGQRVGYLRPGIDFGDEVNPVKAMRPEEDLRDIGAIESVSEVVAENRLRSDWCGSRERREVRNIGNGLRDQRVAGEIDEGHVAAEGLPIEVHHLRCHPSRSDRRWHDRR